MCSPLTVIIGKGAPHGRRDDTITPPGLALPLLSSQLTSLFMPTGAHNPQMCLSILRNRNSQLLVPPDFFYDSRQWFIHRITQEIFQIRWQCPSTLATLKLVPSQLPLPHEFEEIPSHPGRQTCRPAPLVVGPAQTGFPACRPLLPKLAVPHLSLCMPCLALSWEGFAQALRVEGPVLLRQGSPSMILTVLRSGSTLVQNVPLYTCDLASLQSRNKNPRTSAVT